MEHLIMEHLLMEHLLMEHLYCYFIKPHILISNSYHNCQLTSCGSLYCLGFRPAIACLERLKDNPPCEPVVLPQSYYQCTDAFLRA